MHRLLYGLLALVALAWAGSAHAQLAPAPPTKYIYFYNNSGFTMYPVVVGTRYLPPAQDLWMQTQFGVKKPDAAKRPFGTTFIARVYVNRDTGVPSGKSVKIAVPFYTQLLGCSGAACGAVNDQFIDWWNSMRVYVFNGKDAADSAYNFTQDAVTPPSITPLAGAQVPSCTSTDMPTCTVLMKKYTIDASAGIFAQFAEYTFASALITDFTIDTSWVNYNVSAVDRVYMPMGVGAHGVTDPGQKAQNTWLGSNMPVVDFYAQLASFAQKGDLWPQFVPVYYKLNDLKPYYPTPPAGTTAYPGTELPSQNVLYTESFRTDANGVPFTPDPPVLTSNTNKQTHWGMIGDVGQAMFDLWKSCTEGGASSVTCSNIKIVNSFFRDDWGKCFPDAPVPPLTDFLREVSGWAQFPGCATDLVTTMGATRYNEAQTIYCDLQYNFFDPKVPYQDYFNPYVQLLHVLLKSNAYAFSIDDAVSFKRLQGDGVVFTVGPGTRGFENPTQQPLPTATTYHTYCRPPA